MSLNNLVFFLSILFLKSILDFSLYTKRLGIFDDLILYVALREYFT